MGHIGYSDFSDKENSVLGTKKVSKLNDIDDIFALFNKYKKKEGKDRLMFRGVKEAAFKMYTSSQREWVKDGCVISYTDYLVSEFNKAKNWNDGIIHKYLASQNKGFENYIISYFSIMQHFGSPTPLLDFTYDPFKALYFGCNDVDNCYFDDDIDNIRNYFCIYFVDPEWFSKKGLTTKLSDIEIGNFSFDTILQLENNELIYNNLNIIAQDGLFMINTSSDLDLISVLRKNGNIDNQKFFPCYNIHKSLAKIIRERLKKMNIDNDALFPDLNKLKNRK